MYVSYRYIAFLPKRVIRQIVHFQVIVYVFVCPVGDRINFETLAGSLYGSARPRIDLLTLIDLHRCGKLMLDELLTRTYPLSKINEAYDALAAGEVARSLILPQREDDD